MRKVEVCVAETSYGIVEITVADDADDQAIINTARTAVENGNAVWNESEITVGLYSELPLVHVIKN